MAQWLGQALGACALGACDAAQAVLHVPAFIPARADMCRHSNDATSSTVADATAGAAEQANDKPKRPCSASETASSALARVLPSEGSAHELGFLVPPAGKQRAWIAG